MCWDWSYIDMMNRKGVCCGAELFVNMFEYYDVLVVKSVK